MKNTLKLALTSMLSILNVSAFTSPAAHWEGVIHMGEKEVGFTVDLAEKSKGEWIGTMNLKGSDLKDAPLAGISASDAAVKFILPGLPDPPSFEGKLSEDGSALTGTATSKEGSVPFELKRNGVAKVNLPAPSTALAKEFEGNWAGTLDVPGDKHLHAVLKLARAADGTGTGSLTSTDEGTKEFPISTIIQKGKELIFEIRLIGSKYTGTLNDSGTEISGVFALQGVNLPLVLKRP